MTDERYMRPGLEFATAKLCEEAGETLAAVGKIMRWGFHSVNPELPPSQQETNERWLLRELGDLKEAIDRFHNEFNGTTPHQREYMFGYGKWRPIETAPQAVKVITGYKNSLGNWRSVMARYYATGTLDASEDQPDDEDYAPEGWYEESETHDAVLPCDCAPTHWMPLPEGPK